jgi:tRNA(Ile2) C34 agmatinyltransferase TiaS
MADEKFREITVTRRLKVRDAVCPVCGSTFRATGRGVYCTSACRVRADYARHGDERRRAAREAARRRSVEARDAATAADANRPESGRSRPAQGRTRKDG